jgi:hypothetical protein
MSTKETSFSEQLYDENRDTSAVGMTAIKDSETFAELDSG